MRLYCLGSDYARERRVYAGPVLHRVLQVIEFCLHNEVATDVSTGPSRRKAVKGFVMRGTLH